LFFICIYFSSLLVCIIRIYALTTIFPCTTLFRSPADVAARRNGDRPAIRGGGRGQRRQVLRVHPDHQRLLTGEVCDGAPHHVGHDLRFELHRLAHDLPRRRKGKDQEVVLDRRETLRLCGPHRPGGLLDRAHRRLEACGLRACALVAPCLVSGRVSRRLPRLVALAVFRLERYRHLPRRFRGGLLLGSTGFRILRRDGDGPGLRLGFRLRRDHDTRQEQLLRCPHFRVAALRGHHGPHAHSMTRSSLPPLMTISPASSRARTTLTIAPCAASTSRSRTAPRNSISSLSAATARCDIVPRILFLTSSLAAFSARASSF